MELKVQQYCEIEWDYLIHLQPNFNLGTHNSCVNNSNQNTILCGIVENKWVISVMNTRHRIEKNYGDMLASHKRSYFCLQLHANHETSHALRGESPNILGKHPRCFANKSCCCCCCCCCCCVVDVAVAVVEAVVVIVAVVVVVVVVVRCFSSLLSLWLLLVIVVVVVVLLRPSVPLLCAHQL